MFTCRIGSRIRIDVSRVGIHGNKIRTTMTTDDRDYVPPSVGTITTTSTSTGTPEFRIPRPPANRPITFV